VDDTFHWGFASSPTLWEGTVFVQSDVGGLIADFVVAFDVSDGEELWRVEREELWRIRGNSKITVASPATSQGMVLVTGGYQSPSPIYAVRLGVR
jgi:outer membrane protein assembly factor BamB